MRSEGLLYIENDALRVGITVNGAEMRVLYDKNARYDILKCPDDPSWGGTAPLLFPICGRLTEQTTRIGGTDYRMGTHGFLGASRFTVTSHKSDRLELSFSGSDEIYEGAYPFRFTVTAKYTVRDRSLETRLTVKNRDTVPIPFTVGFHPAFRLPLADHSTRDDAYLEFPENREPQAWRLSESGFLLRGTDAYPLQGGCRLPLTAEVFSENTSVFLEKTGDRVRLRSRGCDRSIRLDYEGFPYLGLWRPDDEGASFICIEPWMGCPDYDGEITELSKKRDMLLLPAGETRSFAYTVTVE